MVSNVTAFVPLTRQHRVLILLGLGLLVAGMGLANAAIGHANQLLPFLALFVLASVLAAPLLFYKSRWGLFHPLIFWVLWFGIFHEIIRKIPQFTVGLDRHIALPGVGEAELARLVAYGVLLTALGFVAMYFGYMASPRPKVLKLTFAQPKYLVLKITAVAVFSTFSLLVLANEMGGIDRLALQRGLRSDMRAGAILGGHWTVAVGVLKTACLVWLALRPDDWKRIVFICFFLFALLIGFIATGSRGGLIMPVVLAGVILALRYRKIRLGRSMVVGIVVGIFGLIALGVLGEFRSQSRGAEGLGDIQLELGLVGGAEQGLDSLTGYAGRSSGLYAILGRVPNQVDYLYGRSYLAIPAAPIPSRLWEDKPMAGGRLTGWLIFDRGMAGGGVPPGNIGEAYWNFGVLGVILVMFLFGIVLRWLAAFYEANNGAGWVVIIYVVSLFSLQPNSVSFYSWLHAIVPAIVLLVFFSGLPQSVKRAGNYGNIKNQFPHNSRDLN
ncbi:O-antigen polysaccharide polymerase Wzy family protein [Ectothiorhodospira haloalkaliphila]|uniref:O-antigen polysaccharide polymerase Wzy n=1 Tax=Ectothiorhodospira haloalkaliphila TaxID=421628 RepID=UPI001EE8CAFA|nr:O-antigen polysaccharide polymerase Wzy [Ectothiorhodospira haloalkaliphila]MCG5525278.1 O-antigen polysaccharide polymerase Wzy family protein [Ectothiorhodospira haloalkaliphila]